MINRLTALSAALAVAAAASIAFAADAHHGQTAMRATNAKAAPTEIIVMPTVMVTGHRSR